MLWPCQSTPATKIYSNGKLCVRDPDGDVTTMVDCFSEAGYEKWINKLAALLHLGNLGRCICTMVNAVLVSSHGMPRKTPHQLHKQSNHSRPHKNGNQSMQNIVCGVVGIKDRGGLFFVHDHHYVTS